MERKEVIKIIVNEIEKLRLEHPIRVGVSGITASGKSTLAQEIALEIVSRGYPCIKTSIDNFHNPQKLRYAEAESYAHAYYENAHDYDAIIERLLKPLGKGGNLTYQTQSLDLEADIPLKRGVQRDQVRLGGEVATRKRYLERYHKASAMYLNNCHPISKAQAMVNNNNINEPELTLLGDSKRELQWYPR